VAEPVEEIPTPEESPQQQSVEPLVPSPLDSHSAASTQSDAPDSRTSPGHPADADSGPDLAPADGPVLRSSAGRVARRRLSADPGAVRHLAGRTSRGTATNTAETDSPLMEEKDTASKVSPAAPGPPARLHFKKATTATLRR
jgi:hypothetical protein